MKAWGERIKFGLYIAVGVMSVVNVSLYLYLTILRHSVEASQLFLCDPTHEKPEAPNDGYSATGERVVFPSGSVRGVAIRYAWPGCPYCRADEQRWNTLKSQLVAKGYRIYVIPPAADDAYPIGSPEIADSTQITYVNVGWIKKYRLSATPTTLLLNCRTKIIWTHAGAMTEADQKSALQAVDWNR